jgi:dTDP-4-amino-4,6-dideoxy-D-galactose acyltransferase
MAAPYQLLDWDTEFFGMPVARVTEPDLTPRQLAVVLGELKTSGVKLVYWPASRECDAGVVRQFGGLLADRKTTFCMDLRGISLVPADGVEPFTPSMSVQQLEALAVQSSEHSRFTVDPRIPREKCEALFRVWIQRSLNQEVAEEVLVVREGDRVVGMVTLGNKAGRGDIGLIAVDQQQRGKRHGERLVRAAQGWFAGNGYECGQVVTQGRNLAACGLFRKCGYAVEKVEYFYHFWLAEA